MYIVLITIFSFIVIHGERKLCECHTRFLNGETIKNSVKKEEEISSFNFFKIEQLLRIIVTVLIRYSGKVEKT